MRKRVQPKRKIPIDELRKFVKDTRDAISQGAVGHLAPEQIEQFKKEFMVRGECEGDDYDKPAEFTP